MRQYAAAADGAKGRKIILNGSRRTTPSARWRASPSLLLYTGQRRSDVVKLGRQHIQNDTLTIDQGKTEGGEEAHLEIPVHPKLREIIDATPTVGVGFGNWFRELCNAADCPDVSVACARRPRVGSPRSGAARTRSRQSLGTHRSPRCSAIRRRQIASAWHARQ
jgi:integrase